ncbi:GNAT family N-acetyltransferase [Salinivibrio sp. ES.052]|uniref:GNAT family N-acetyltransferase n=1 Tax=Salinivibrio sp. ES.052 TaxID=1882823 RepID=UPI00092AFF2B|nr:N-acetyltransferase [Salinivibrio sp. ES.052]SIO38111.1 putative acetyltransferase [Salinivibrio sp. ES.052]
MNIEIRNEAFGDEAKIHQVTEQAFLNTQHADHTEQFIVDALRRAGALTISLVAQVDGDIVGHVAISPVTLSDSTSGWFGLGPISIIPEFQGRGIGSQLMQRSLAVLETMGASGCTVLGDPAFYGRFGFTVVDGLVFPGVPDEYFQALSFSDEFPQGEVSYHEAFSAEG